MKAHYVSLLLLTCCMLACTNKSKSLPETQPELKTFLQHTPDDMKEGAEFLIENMPQRDRDSLTESFLRQHLVYAYKARQTFSWCKVLPDSIFLNEVLPYALLNEKRESWRKDFFEKYTPIVSQCKTMTEAIDSIEAHIVSMTGVNYNTKREKADQAPYESIRQGMASCTGLSILLCDVFRSVGIPSRIGGTPDWYDHSGNHNWVEVWVDGKWCFTEYYPDKAGLNHSWFLPRSAKADIDDPQQWMYASSFKPTGLSFPLVWDSTITYVHAKNVTDRYIATFKEQFKNHALQKDECLLKITLYKTAKKTGDNRERKIVKVMDSATGKMIADGPSPEAKQDLNDQLQIVIKKHKLYTLVVDDKILKTIRSEKAEESVDLFIQK